MRQFLAALGLLVLLAGPGWAQVARVWNVETVTVGSSPVSPTTNLCLTGDVQTSVQIQVVRGSIYYSLHSASFTPTATNSFRLSETPVQTVYVPDASLLRMVRQGNVDALVVIGCITGR
jgi:hypothetical protein